MSPPRNPALASAAVLCSLAFALTGCSGGDEESGGGAPAAAPEPQASATPQPAPADAACYRMSYAAALAFTSDAEPVRCQQPHATQTYAVGEIDNMVDGHLLAVDSQQVKDQVAEGCPQQLGEFLGGSQADQRLSMLRPVWFTPSLEQSDAGANWYRCDVVLLGGDESLAQVKGDLKGALGSQQGRDTYGMCGTAAPDADDFTRVPCSKEHSWRAVEVVDFPESQDPAAPYPGEDEAQARGQGTCEDAGNAAAEDPLDFQWGYEWPTKTQWDEGQTFGRCWVPERPG